MCFSAAASFTSGIALSAVGIISVQKAESRSDIPFASIPLLFGGQQIVEGFLWLSLTNPDYAFLAPLTSYSFLVFAQVIWPMWVPFSIYKFNIHKNNRGLKLAGRVMIALGVLIGITMGYYLYTFPVNGEILGCHISYEQTLPTETGLLGGALYLIATIGPHFTTMNKRMWVLGLAILGSYIFTELFYTQYVVSVWCFFAAILSVIILWIVVGKNKG